MISKTIRDKLEQAGVTVNGPQPWDIQIHDKRWYRRVLFEKNIGLGESYMDGWWDCQRIDEMICRLLRSGLEDEVKGSMFYLLRFWPAFFRNLQSKARSRIIAKRHYDLDNDLFFPFSMLIISTVVVISMAPMIWIRRKGKNWHSLPAS